MLDALFIGDPYSVLSVQCSVYTSHVPVLKLLHAESAHVTCLGLPKLGEQNVGQGFDDFIYVQGVSKKR